MSMFPRLINSEEIAGTKGNLGAVTFLYMGSDAGSIPTLILLFLDWFAIPSRQDMHKSLAWTFSPGP